MKKINTSSGKFKVKRIPHTLFREKSNTDLRRSGKKASGKKGKLFEKKITTGYLMHVLIVIK